MLYGCGRKEAYRLNMNRTNDINTPSLLHKLLIAPQYKIQRHLLLAAVIAVISLNQAFMTFLDGLDVLGYKIYLQAGLIFASYMLAGYYNFFVMLPRYLPKGQYARYILLLAAYIFLLVIFQTGEECCVLRHFQIANSSYDFPNVCFNVLSAFVLILFALSGGAITILLKYWLTENEKMGELEKRHVQSEVEQLKEQVSPHLLFRTLNRAGVQAQKHPSEASAMLLRLSQLLRYQLYDCNREHVLLSAEIKFLNNYLALEQSHSGTFSFTVRADKETGYTLVAPLLFISFVQAAVRKIYEQNSHTALELDFSTSAGNVTFCFSSTPAPLFIDIDYSRINQRLNLLYPGRHSLSISDRCITLNLNP